MVTTLFGEGQTYRRLSRSKPTVLGSLSLWEGADHFVLIEVLGFSETHKRFYFQDIKALSLRQTQRGFWLHLLFGFATLLSGAVALWILGSGNSPGGGWDWLPVAVPSGFAVGWLVHLALGPTCACYVTTPVQNARLGALARTRPARKILGYLARRAQTSQGGALEVPVPLTEASVVATPALDEVRQPESIETESSGNEDSETFLPRLYPIVSSISLVNAALLFSLLVWDFYPLRAVQVFFVVGLIILGITCAASTRTNRRSNMASWFKRIGWALFGVNGLVFLLWYGYGFYLAALSRSANPGAELAQVQQMLEISPHGSRFWFWVVLVDAWFSMIVGLAGLLVILWRKGFTRDVDPRVD